MSTNKNEVLRDIDDMLSNLLGDISAGQPINASRIEPGIRAHRDRARIAAATPDPELDARLREYATSAKFILRGVALMDGLSEGLRNRCAEVVANLASALTPTASSRLTQTENENESIAEPDGVETIETNPKSWIAWKRKALQMNDALQKIANITDGHPINADRRDRINFLANSVTLKSAQAMKGDA